MFGFACFMSFVMGLVLLYELLIQDYRDAAQAAVICSVAILMGWLSNRLVQISLFSQTIEIRSLFGVRLLTAQDFLNVESIGVGLMRMDFKQNRSVYFLPDYLISYPLINSFEAWSQNTRLSREEQIDLFCGRVYELMR